MMRSLSVTGLSILLILSCASFASAQAPEVTTDAVDNIGITTATGHGTLNALNDSSVSQHGVCWSTSQDPTTAGPHSELGPYSGLTPHTFDDSDITSLLPDTTYYVRAYATNTVDTSYGGEVSFRTDPQPPTVTTQAVSEPTKDSAVGHGTITDVGIPSPTQHGFVWSWTETNPTLGNNDGSTQLGEASATGPFTSTITGLIPYKFYYVRAYATNTAGDVYGIAQTFSTDPEAMEVETEPVTNIDQTSATGGGDIIELGIPAATQHGICWNTTGSPTTNNEKTEMGAPAATGSFSSDMTGLTPGTTYYVRAYITNPLETVYGGQVNFTSYIAPAVTTLPVSLITDTTAIGNGNISNKGVPVASAHGVCWSRTETNPTLDNNGGFTDEGMVLGTGTFQSNMTNLIPNTTYYVRAYATNTVETVYGSPVTFVTDPSVAGISTFEVTNISTDTATANGIISALGEPPPVQHGFCWSTDSNPNVDDSADNKVELGSYSGYVPYLFDHVMTSLTSGTLYYVRAYATSLAGTVYGNQVTFTPIVHISAAERAALIDLYNSTNGDSWYDNSGWKTPPLDVDGFAMPGTEDGWNGVTVSIDTVTEIWAPNNNINGEIPQSISDLSSLETLYLYGNQITAIPPEIGDLSSLETLNLSGGGQLTTIPPEIGNLTNLETLSLNNCVLTAIPSQIESLTNLEVLFLRSCDLTVIPPEIGSLSNLKYLDLSENQIIIIPPEIGDLSLMDQLTLHSNDIMDIPPELEILH